MPRTRSAVSASPILSGADVRLLRVLRHKSQIEIAQAATAEGFPLSDTALSEFERGKRPIPPRLIVVLARVLLQQRDGNEP
jgi:hypothetical protein